MTAVASDLKTVFKRMSRSKTITKRMGKASKVAQQANTGCLSLATHIQPGTRVKA